MAASPSDVKAAFQDAIPHRRDEFARRVEQLRAHADSSRRIVDYPAEVLLLAESELRSRIKLAADRVKQLIKSGWTATQMVTVRKAFLDCFGTFDRMDKDPQSDLYHAVEAAFGEAGTRNPPQATMNARRLSEVQVQTATECLSDLELEYAAQNPSVAAPTAETALEDAKVVAEAVQHWKSEAFISYASEDRPFVKDLAERLRASGVRIWLDETELTVGDSLIGKIDEALKTSQYGIVILSQMFFSKDWPRLELDGLLSIQTSSHRKVILPVWHRIDKAQIAQYSPVLAGRLATKSSDGIDKVVRDLLRVLRPDANTGVQEQSPGPYETASSFREQIIEFVREARGLVLQYGPKPSAEQRGEVFASYIKMAGVRYHAIKHHLEKKLGYKRVEALAKLPMPMTVEAILKTVDVLETLAIEVPDYLPAYPVELDGMS